MASLLDDLRAVADVIDPSLLPTANETNKLLGVLIHYEDKGKELFEVAAQGAEDLSGFLSDERAKVQDAEAGAGSVAPNPAAAPVAVPAVGVAPTAAGTPADGEQDEINQLRDQVAALSARLATSQQTVVTHETDVPDLDATPTTAPAGIDGDAFQSNRPQQIQSAQSTPIPSGDTESK